MSLRYTWRNTFITALNVPSPAGNIRWLAMWSARKIITRASADTPWATRSRAGAGRDYHRHAVVGAQQQRKRDRPACDPEPGVRHRIVQHGEYDADKGKQSRRRDGNQGRALCAQLRHSR